MVLAIRCIYFLVVASFLTPTWASICPPGCMCTTTRDGLHRAACSDLTRLFKFTLRQRHHNINILDLSHNNITKLSHELDRLTEVVTLDLSTNGIVELNKFLNNAKKLVHLNLANNRIKTLSLSHLPTSVSSLDLTNNLLNNVPSDIRHLTNLEHLELEGNPLDCTCENIKTRDYLLHENVFIDPVLCSTPIKFQGKSWLELKTKEVCSIKSPEFVATLDTMVGDQPIDAIRIGRETTQLRSMSLVASNDLEDGEVVEGANNPKDEDNLMFIKADKKTLKPHHYAVEGSGDGEVTTVSDVGIKTDEVLETTIQETEQFMLVKEYTTDDPLNEGSGWGNIEEGSGTDIPDLDNTELITTAAPPLFTGPIEPFFSGHFFSNTSESTSEYPIPPTLDIFENNESEVITTAMENETKDNNVAYTEGPFIVYTKGMSSEEPSAANTNDRVANTEASIVSITRDTTVSEPIKGSSGVKDSTDEEKNSKKSDKAGTYVCIALIVILLVGLIGFAIIKGQIRKRRDRRLLRQQRRDVEKASKEMVDMNKSLLGKPAPVDNIADRKINGKYELVPTHEPTQKKGENGGIRNGINHDPNVLKENSSRDGNPNKGSSHDNNLSEQQKPGDPARQETSFNMSSISPDSKKDTHSLSSDDVFVPINDDDQPHLNGITDSEISQPLINGNPNNDSDFLSPSREYVPVYSPDMGRVRIKLTETPKPKTPVLVTRSRSNAGDLIITPTSDTNNRKSTT